MLLGFGKRVVKIKGLRLSANMEQRGKGSLDERQPSNPVRVISPHPILLSRCERPRRPTHCICCFFRSQGQVRSSSLSSLRSQIHLSLKDYIFLCSLIRCPFDLGLQRQTKKIFRDNRLFLHHDFPWHGYICVYLYIQGCMYLKNDFKPL